MESSDGKGKNERVACVLYVRHWLCGLHYLVVFLEPSSDDVDDGRCNCSAIDTRSSREGAKNMALWKRRPYITRTVYNESA